MNLNLAYITPNKWYHKVFNCLCLVWLNTRRKLKTDSNEPSEQSPVFVTGFFRSGTSLTTYLLQELGFDLGPQNHLLQAKNERAELNPDGFFENYLFMEMSLFAFTKLNSWGHLPPKPDEVDKLNFDITDRNQFAEYTLCGVHDDRISNINKIDALTEYDILSLETYLKDKFNYPFAIKNPHFSVLSKFLIKKWPKARFIVCFREPSEAIASAAKITKHLNESIYLRYYSELLNLPQDQVVFLSHKHLLNDTTKTLNLLVQKFNLDKNKIEQASKIIKPELHRFKNDQKALSSEVNSVYQTLLSRAINT